MRRVASENRRWRGGGGVQKIIGAVLVIVSGMLFASSHILKEKTKLHNLKEMQKALFYMKQEILFSGKILARIITEAASRTEGDVGAFLCKLGEELKNHETESLSSCFFKVKGEKTFLPDEAESILADFFKEAGSFSGELEERHLDTTLTKLARVEKEAREGFLKNKKLNLTLGICVSFGVVMLLL